jgi:hypothetical protein
LRVISTENDTHQRPARCDTVAAMTALRQIAGLREFLLVGDSKLVSYNNLAAMIAAGVGFVAPASKTYVPATVLADLDLNTAAEVDYLAERDTGKPADTRGRWRVVEDTMTVSGPRKKDPVLTLRRVFVHSSGRHRGRVAPLSVSWRWRGSARVDRARTLVMISAPGRKRSAGGAG